MHSYTPAKRIVDGPLINLLILCISIPIFSRAHPNCLKFATFTDCFPGSGAESLAAKGLTTAVMDEI